MSNKKELNVAKDRLAQAFTRLETTIENSTKNFINDISKLEKRVSDLTEELELTSNNYQELENMNNEVAKELKNSIEYIRDSINVNNVEEQDA